MAVVRSMSDGVAADCLSNRHRKEDIADPVIGGAVRYQAQMARFMGQQQHCMLSEGKNDDRYNRAPRPPRPSQDADCNKCPACQRVAGRMPDARASEIT